MRAAALKDEASSLEIIDIPQPIPGAGQILVKVTASSLNGFDIVVAAGYLKQMMEHRYPVVVGKDFAGVVAGLGEGSSKFSVGDRVFGVVMTPYLGEGGFGEYLVVSEGPAVAKIPAVMSDVEAGALALAGASAVDAVDSLNLAPGKSVLIIGATGGVGALAIQYAVAAGATVIATARVGAEAEFVRSFGAHQVVDGRADLASNLKEIAPQGVDAIVHLAGDASGIGELLKAQGKIASLLGFGADQNPAAQAIMAMPSEPTLDRLAADVVAKKVRVPITATVKLADLPEAVKNFSGKLGKVSITI